MKVLQILDRMMSCKVLCKILIKSNNMQDLVEISLRSYILITSLILIKILSCKIFLLLASS